LVRFSLLFLGMHAGFGSEPLAACCGGGGGQYNFDFAFFCGTPL
jgi:hypothetical protein